MRMRKRTRTIPKDSTNDHAKWKGEEESVRLWIRKIRALFEQWITVQGKEVEEKE